MAGADAKGQMALLYSTVHTDNSTEKDPEPEKTEATVTMTEPEFLVGEGCFAKVRPHSCQHLSLCSCLFLSFSPFLQVRGFPFWPAKVTKLGKNKAGTTIEVLFFGTKEVATLGLKDIAKVRLTL